jgi:hypothetical protein
VGRSPGEGCTKEAEGLAGAGGALEERILVGLECLDELMTRGNAHDRISVIGLKKSFPRRR